MQQEGAMREEILKIMKEKDDIEKAIMDINEYLTAPGMPGLKGNLVDEEGFPRADLDLFEIRKMRNRLACLQTDHQAVMKKIEQNLFSLHETHLMGKQEEEVKQSALTHKKQNETMSQSSESGAPKQVIQELKIPFAWVSDVIADSPAEQAGLKFGDAVYLFGDVNSQNHNNFQGIVELVKRSLNQTITIKLLRKTLLGTSEEKVIEFVPSEWGGRGYTGFAIKPNPV